MQLQHPDHDRYADAAIGYEWKFGSAHKDAPIMVPLLSCSETEVPDRQCSVYAKAEEHLMMVEDVGAPADGRFLRPGEASQPS